MRKVTTYIRLLESEDIPAITRAFQEIGWNKPASKIQVNDDLALYFTKTLK